MGAACCTGIVKSSNTNNDDKDRSKHASTSSSSQPQAPIARVNEKQYVTQKIEQAAKLKQLNIADCAKLEKLVQNYPKVKELSLQVVNVTNCPKLGTNDLDVISSSGDQIRKLAFTSTLLDAIPHSVFKDNLQVLNLQWNKIQVIPKELQNASNLKELDLSNNQIKGIPEEMTKLTKLQIITLSNNQLKIFDTAVYLNLPSLEFLYLQHNQISSIQQYDGWSKSSLKVIDLEGNQLATVPTPMLKDSKLHNLNIRGNFIIKPQLMRMEGLEEYQARRKLKMDIVVNNHLDVDFNICGLTS